MQTTYGSTKLRWLTRDELNKILDHANGARLMFEAIYYYGLRRSEIGLLQPSDIDGESIWITRLKRKGKGGRYRHALPLIGRLRKKLSAIKTPFLFMGYKEKGISGSAVAKAWEGSVHRSGLYRYNRAPTIHCLKHSCCMNFFSLRGRSIEECNAWIGHSALASTAVYYRIEANQLLQLAKDMEKLI